MQCFLGKICLRGCFGVNVFCSRLEKHCGPDCTKASRDSANHAIGHFTKTKWPVQINHSNIFWPTLSYWWNINLHSEDVCMSIIISAFTSSLVHSWYQIRIKNCRLQKCVLVVWGEEVSGLNAVHFAFLGKKRIKEERWESCNAIKQLLFDWELVDPCYCVIIWGQNRTSNWCRQLKF